jgi:hypothetical protein
MYREDSIKTSLFKCQKSSSTKRELDFALAILRSRLLHLLGSTIANLLHLPCVYAFQNTTLPLIEDLVYFMTKQLDKTHAQTSLPPNMNFDAEKLSHNISFCETMHMIRADTRQ